MKITYEQDEKAIEYVIKNLITSGMVKPWFETREACENWMGDVFSEAVIYYMEALLNEPVFYADDEEEEQGIDKVLVTED